MTIIDSTTVTAPAILGYNQMDYQKKYPEQFITGFTHGSMTKGPIDVNRAKEIVKILNEKISNNKAAVHFDESSIDKELTGGSCSSIAFRVGLIALEHLKNSNDDGLPNCVKEIVEKMNKLPRSGRKEVRTLQGAYNTIQVDTSIKTDDISQEKIKALASFFDMKIGQSTEELIIDETDHCKTACDGMMNKLHAGVYLVRVIRKENNHKLETQGHSTIYIKLENGNALFFDTQLGLYNVDHKQDLIYQSMCALKRHFSVDACKFHQLVL